MTATRVDVVTDAEVVSQLYEGIMTRAFPARELLPLEELVDQVGRGHAEVLAVRGSGAWLGLAVLESYPCGVTLLAYLAVTETARGQGVGGRLIRAVQDRPSAAFPGVLAEIEPPHSTPDRVEFGDPVRRARFYAAAGARAVTVAHWQPPVAPGMPAVPLQLIVIPAPGTHLDAIDASVVLAFERDYHADDADPEPLSRTIASIGDRRAVRLDDLTPLYG